MIIEDTSKGADTACKEIGISSRSFREYIKIIGEEAEKRYARAKDDQIRVIAEETMSIADEPIELGDTASVNNKRVRIDTRKWLLSKLKPKIYGDQITVNDPNKSLPTTLRIELVQPKARQQLGTDKQDITGECNVSD